jgi:hypothetical protein
MTTSDNQSLARAPNRVLVDHPQRLHLLPTLWFWRDPANWRVVRWPNLALVMTAAFGTISRRATGTVVPSFWAGFAAASVAQYLGLGLFERWLRRRAMVSRSPGA